MVSIFYLSIIHLLLAFLSRKWVLLPYWWGGGGEGVTNVRVKHLVSRSRHGCQEGVSNVRVTHLISPNASHHWLPYPHFHPWLHTPPGWLSHDWTNIESSGQYPFASWCARRALNYIVSFSFSDLFFSLDHSLCLAISFNRSFLNGYKLGIPRSFFLITSWMILA